MESRPQNPEFRNNPDNFHPCRVNLHRTSPEGAVKSGFTLFVFKHHFLNLILPILLSRKYYLLITSTAFIHYKIL